MRSDNAYVVSLRFWIATLGSKPRSTRVMRTESPSLPASGRSSSVPTFPCRPHPEDPVTKISATAAAARFRIRRLGTMSHLPLGPSSIRAGRESCDALLATRLSFTYSVADLVLARSTQGQPMKTFVAFLALALLAPCAAVAQSTPDFSGLWQATLRLGPDISGPLVVYRTADGWRADIAGFSVPAVVNGRAVSFTLPDGRGSFKNGHWYQPDRFATPVPLVAEGPNRWRGTVKPLENRLTMYLPVTRQPDGTLRTYLRNPERNWGR